MSLTPGASIGPYEIVEAIGAGGMGEVYRARDARLNRHVALKVLPDRLAADPDRLARFRREAQMLAALNHPNIGHIYGFEDSGATHALVLELIEGPTLADRIARGPIALAEALPIARQLAEALDAAHEQGIIHRDLKPANIKVRADGTVKVLDFGLAKALDSGGAGSAVDATASPTVTAAATERGVILGTAAYMAPEQARGTVVDKRADIWAFGVVLYEMLTGAPRTLIGSMESAPVYAPPAGSGRADAGWLLFTRQGVLAAQPFDAKALRTTGEAASLGDQPTVAPGPAAFGAGHRVSVSTAGSLAYFLEPRGNTSVLWLDGAGKTTGTVNVPPGQYSAVAIAPDGARAVLVRSDSPTRSSLWLVDLTRESAVPLSTGGGQNASPIWSPDSTRIVFASDRDGQSALFEKTVADSSPERRISRLDLFSTVLNGWSPDGAWIVVSAINPDTKWNVYRLPASGSGTPVPIVNGPGIEVGGSLWPGGHWLAYLSDEAGRLDLFVQSFPEPGSRVQISTGGAQLSWWTRDERRLLFLDRQHTLWRVDVDLRATPPRIGTPQEVAAFSSNLVAMAPAPDRQRFLALVSEHVGLGAVTVVQSWRAALPASR